MKERHVNELPEREPDVREKLMNDIKQHRTLRPTPGNLAKKGKQSSFDHVMFIVPEIFFIYQIFWLKNQ